MDLQDFNLTEAQNDGAWLDLRHPRTDAVLTGEDGNPIAIRLAGIDSDRFQDTQLRLQNAKLKRVARRGKVETKAEELREDRVQLVAACTLAFSGNFTYGGAALQASPASAADLYRKERWILEQAEAFIEDRGNFCKVSPTLS
ncbi:MAG: hypothetical protein NXI16_09270 [Alphaproteobacteria bacterium]|nr:hypothetical protein [Alphaproteobacteria bacterium]